MNLNNEFQLDINTTDNNMKVVQNRPTRYNSIMTPQRSSAMRSSMKGAKQKRNFSPFRTGSTVRNENETLTVEDFSQPKFIPSKMVEGNLVQLTVQNH